MPCPRTIAKVLVPLAATVALTVTSVTATTTAPTVSPTPSSPTRHRLLDAVSAARTATSGKPGEAAVSATASVRVARPGTRVRVSGQISGPAGRVFRLARRTPSGWVVVRQGRTTGARTYGISLNARSGRPTTYRVEAPARGSDPSGSSDTFTVASRGGHGPLGTSGMYALITGPGDRWDPCTTIGWRFNPTGGYAGSLEDVMTAFADLSRASGLQFRYLGPSDRVAVRDSVDADTQILVSWADPIQVPALAGRVVGLGGPEWTSAGSEGTSRAPVEYTGGSVALDRTDDLRPGFAATGDATWGQVVEHELGHVVGLGHYESETQLMDPVSGPDNHALGAGDLEGLRVLGSAAGCFPIAATPTTGTSAPTDAPGALSP